MVLFTVEVLVIVVLIAAWWAQGARRAAGRAVHPSATGTLRRPAPEPPEPPVPPPPAAPSGARSLGVRVLFVEPLVGKVILDCTVADGGELVAPGEVLTVAVALPGGLEDSITALFERWSLEDVELVMTAATGARGPRLRFVGEDTRVDLELLAASRLHHT